MNWITFRDCEKIFLNGQKAEKLGVAQIYTDIVENSSNVDDVIKIRKKHAVITSSWAIAQLNVLYKQYIKKYNNEFIGLLKDEK